MPKFRVLKGHDAYAMYETIIEAESVEQANDFAYADKFADIWTPTGETREFDEINVLVDETEEVTDDTVADEMQTIVLAPAERDVIIAALRLWQAAEVVPKSIMEIATNGGDLYLDNGKIDMLIEEKLNG